MMWLVTFTLAVLANGISAQMCTQADLDINDYNKPDPLYCELFHRCMPDLTSQPQLCGIGTLFDVSIARCNHEAVALNSACRCVQGMASTNYSSPCCNNYLECDGQSGTLSRRSCPKGMVYKDGMCRVEVNGLCVNNTVCPRPQVKKGVCMNYAVQGEPCKFRQLGMNNVDFGVKDCAAGTAFNASTCSCSIMNMNCGGNIVDPNRLRDKCAPTIIMDFSDARRVHSYTMKTKNGQRELNKYYIQANGYSSVNGQAMIGYASGQPGFLALSTFARNMLMGPFGFSVTFRTNNAKAFTVVGNGVNTRCGGTMDVVAEYKNNAWTVSLEARGKLVKGNPTLARLAASVSSVLDTPVTVSVIFDGDAYNHVNGYVRVTVRAGNSNVKQSGRQEVGGSIDAGVCPLFVGYGLVGSLSKVDFYESCNDVKILENTIVG